MLPKYVLSSTFEFPKLYEQFTRFTFVTVVVVVVVVVVIANSPFPSILSPSASMTVSAVVLTGGSMVDAFDALVVPLP